MHQRNAFAHERTGEVYNTMTASDGERWER